MIYIYEVMAVERGFPLFFLEHIKRLHNSIGKSYTVDRLIDISVKLISPVLDKCEGKNIKLVYEVESDNFLVDLIKSRKPDAEAYISGVDVGIVDASRNNPLIKRENISLREMCDTICRENNFYDVLLKGPSGEIPEGSRSNFLGVDKDGNIITSPSGAALNGITRETIFDICRECSITVVERVITEEGIKGLESLIITGTSPEILPVLKFHNKIFNVKNPVIELLKEEFHNRKVKDGYITEEIFRKNLQDS